MDDRKSRARQLIEEVYVEAKKQSECSESGGCGGGHKHLELEYKEAGANLRQYVNRRFAILTLWGIAVGGAVGALMAGDDSFKHAVVAFLGAGVSAVALVAERRAVTYWQHFKDSAGVVGKLLGLCQYREVRGSPVSTTSAVAFMLGGVVLIFTGVGFANLAKDEPALQGVFVTLETVLAWFGEVVLVSALSLAVVALLGKRIVVFWLNRLASDSKFIDKIAQAMDQAPESRPGP